MNRIAPLTRSYVIPQLPRTEVFRSPKRAPKIPSLNDGFHAKPILGAKLFLSVAYKGGASFVLPARSYTRKGSAASPEIPAAALAFLIAMSSRQSVESLASRPSVSYGAG